jgi:hypothetical protein
MGGRRNNAAIRRVSKGRRRYPIFGGVNNLGVGSDHKSFDAELGTLSESVSRVLGDGRFP